MTIPTSPFAALVTGWEVGLVCGVIYNWRMQRTRSLGDLMLVHAVTNLALSLYVIGMQRWEFWM